MNKIEYVVGFAFSLDKKEIVLIEKIKPLWQKGLLNGIGGKIEEGEQPMNAMIREFREETGVEFTIHEDNYLNWNYFAVLEFEIANLHCFRIFNDDINLCKTKEIEVIKHIKIEDLHHYNTIPNLKVLIPMAMDNDFLFSKIKSA